MRREGNGERDALRPPSARKDGWLAWLTVHESPRWALKPRDKSTVAANGWRREICLPSQGLLSTRISDFDHEAPAASNPSTGLTWLGQNTISSSAIIAKALI